MATAARIHIAEQGRDPRRYRLIAFGGSGPVHAHGLARLLHVQTVVFPRAAGVASAIGMLVAPRSVEYTRSLVCPVERLDWDAVRDAIGELAAKANELMREARADRDEVTLELAADMRYIGQGHEVSVPLADGVVDRRDNAALHAAFEAEYRRRFDRSLGALGAEVVSWRLRARSAPIVDRVEFDVTDQDKGSAQTGERPVYFPEVGKFAVTPVYARSQMRPGGSVHGPAVIEESESTVIASPGSMLHVDTNGNLIMEVM
jgi:N-methylhydantoinase A